MRLPRPATAAPPARAPPPVPAPPSRRPSRLTPPHASGGGGGGGLDSLFDAARRAARTVQGGLPVVGLLSRLAAPAGGVGWDELAYPEFARGLVDNDARNAGGAWAAAATALAARHGAPAQLRNVTLCLWMAGTGGGGLVPAASVVKAARRAAVTNDVEVEMDRFDAARADGIAAAGGGGGGAATPRTLTPPDVATAVAVDALATLCLGLPDGAPIDAEDAALFEALIPPALAFVGTHVTSGGGGGGGDGGAAAGDGAALVRAAVAARGERTYV